MFRRLLIRDIEINFVDLNTNNENAIVMIHGNSQSLNSFQHQLSSSHFPNYRLIALDLPGHGDSSHDSWYSLPRFSEYLSEFISSLKLKSYVLVGHSLGGHIAIEALELLSPAGVLVFGTPPVSKPIHPESFLPSPFIGYLYKNSLDEQEIEDLLSIFHATYTPGQKDITLFRKTDHNFREAFAESLSEGSFKNELVIWENFTGPKAIVLGSEDSIANRDYIASVLDPEDLWLGRVLLLSGGHSVHIDNWPEFNQTLTDFSDHCFSNSGLYSQEALDNYKMESHAHTI